MIHNPDTNGGSNAKLTYFIWDFGVAGGYKARCVFEEGMTWQEFIDSEYNVGVWNSMAGGGTSPGIYKFVADDSNGGTPALAPDAYPGVTTSNGSGYPLLTDKIIPEEEYTTWI